LTHNRLHHFFRRNRLILKQALTNKNKIIGNSLRIYPDDTFLVSYPRSGNTWMRFVLGSIINKTDVTFDNMERLFPDIYQNTHRQLKKIPRPRYIKSHESYDNRYPRVIYLVRDPRDVAISFYFYHKKLNKYEDSFQNFLSLFFRPKALQKLRWDDHLESWRKNASNVKDGIYFVKYEDLLINTVENISTILNFLKFTAEKQEIESSISRNTFKNMQKKEVYFSDNNALFRDTDKEMRFVRSGQKQQWRNFMSDDQVNLFYREFGNLMDIYGYSCK
jgi:hypothetical protein